MKSQQLLAVLALGGLAVFGVGCIATATASASAEAEAPVVFVDTPTLVAVGSGVWVVRESSYATYYYGDFYWVYRSGVWYRSRSYESGWIVVEATIVPKIIVTRDHSAYVQYRGSAGAKTRPAPRGGVVAAADPPPRADPPAKGNPHGGPPGHDDIPGLGNQKKAAGEQPGQVGKSASGVAPGKAGKEGGENGKGGGNGNEKPGKGGGDEKPGGGNGNEKPGKSGKKK